MNYHNIIIITVIKISFKIYYLKFIFEFIYLFYGMLIRIIINFKIKKNSMTINYLIDK